MPGLFERGDPPEGWETKTTDMAGASSKVILASIASEMEYAPDAKPTAFEMSAELRSSVMELPMSPDGSTVKHKHISTISFSLSKREAFPPHMYD